jgi:hypothetical protein
MLVKNALAYYNRKAVFLSAYFTSFIEGISLLVIKTYSLVPLTDVDESFWAQCYKTFYIPNLQMIVTS